MRRAGCACTDIRRICTKGKAERGVGMDARVRKRMCAAAFGIAAALSAAVLGALWLCDMADARRLVCGALGLCFAALATLCLERCWASAPDAGRAVVWYVLHLACELGPVLAAMLLPFADALGVLIPQLFPVPALAVLLAVKKPE